MFLKRPSNPLNSRYTANVLKRYTFRGFMERKYMAFPKKRGFLQAHLYPNLSYSPARCANIRISSWINIFIKSLDQKTRGWAAADF